MVKDIIVNLERRLGRDPARDFAIRVAETFNAHVAGVAFAYAPDLPGYEMLQIPPDILALAESEKTAWAAIESLRCGRQAQSGFGRISPDQGSRGGRASDPVDARPALRSQRVHAIRAKRREQRRHDRDITAPVRPSARRGALHSSEGWAQPRLRGVLLGRQPRSRTRVQRSVAAAGQGTKVKRPIVLDEKTKSNNKEMSSVEIATHLARHDVKVEIETMPAADIDVASAILSSVADLSATRIVMGGYGHAKLREVTLGGVTHDMLKSMTVPVLMSR
jgi:nucleotide-binding universal stress UspA family protein